MKAGLIGLALLQVVLLELAPRLFPQKEPGPPAGRTGSRVVTLDIAILGAATKRTSRLGVREGEMATLEVNEKRFGFKPARSKKDPDSIRVDVLDLGVGDVPRLLESVEASTTRSVETATTPRFSIRIRRVTEG